MDISRIISVTCVLILALCLILSVCVMSFLKNAVTESTAACAQMQSLLERANEQLESPKPPIEDTKVDNSIPADVLYHQFCMREANGKIAIYTSDGYLVQILDLTVAALPEADQSALREGICVSSWREVLALMQDFGV